MGADDLAILLFSLFLGVGIVSGTYQEKDNRLNDALYKSHEIIRYQIPSNRKMLERFYDSRALEKGLVE